MSGRRFAVGAVSPKLCQHPAVVATRHDLRLVGQARLGVQRVPLAGVAAVVPIVELVVVIEAQIEQIRVHVADARRADVHHHAIGRVEVFRPPQHHGEAPCVRVVDAVGVGEGHQGWRSLIEPNGVRPVVPDVHGHHAVRQPKWRHQAPFRAQEWRRLLLGHATLSNERAQVDALPPVGLRQEGVAWHRFDEHVGIDGLVVLVLEPVHFVAAVLGTVGQHLLSDVVPERPGAVVHVVGALEGVLASLVKEPLVDVHQGRRPARRVGKPAPQDAVRRIIDRLFLRFTSQRRVFNHGHVDLNQVRLGDGVVRRPSVIHRHRPMVQVPGMHRWTSQVVSN